MEQPPPKGLPGACTVGLDFGTNSARALVARCSDGCELGTGVADYPSGTDGVVLDPRDANLARQHPGDHLFCLERSVRAALGAASAADPGFSADCIAGIGIAATGSSPLPVDASNFPLAMHPGWSGRPEALCWLWKDHTAHAEAARITELARLHRPASIARCGNTYSPEWFWSKIWHCLSVAPDVFAAAHSWVELCDWLPSVLCGVRDPLQIHRGVCAAGHKALFAGDLGGLPDKEFLSMLDPALADLRDRLYSRAWDASAGAGVLCAEWAGRLGLRAGIPVAVGKLDVHYGAIGAGVGEGVLVKVIGTSACDCAVFPADRAVPAVPGICGIVKGAILPDYYCVEAGQSAVGDIFKWWAEGVCGGDVSLHSELTREAASMAPGEAGLLALDWNNGNRNVLVDQRLTGMLLGQTLHTTRAEIYRALVEATAFGARVILERLAEYGIPTSKIVCAGGIAEKNPVLMQIYADATGREMAVARSPQACALGAAVAASVAAGPSAGGHPDFPSAQSAMSGTKPGTYQPQPAAAAAYNRIFPLYRKVHDAFGGVDRSADLSGVMKELLSIKEGARRTLG